MNMEWLLEPATAGFISGIMLMVMGVLMLALTIQGIHCRVKAKQAEEAKDAARRL